MSCSDNQSNINETFIIEPTFVGADTISACTSVFSNEFASCSGNTKFIMGTDVVTLGGSLFTNNNLSATTISATTYLNLPIDIRVTGGTYTAGTATFRNNTGGTFTITGLYTGGTDVFVTGGTFNNNTLTFRNNTGGTFTITGLYTGGTDVFVTGGTYANGTTTFVNNTGGTFTISGFSTGTTYFVGIIGNTPNASGATINNNILTLQPASSSFGGIMTTSAQTISGNKTWSGITSFENTVRVNNNNLFRLYDTGNVNNASIGFSQITYPTTFPILNFILNGASLGGFSQDGLQMVGKQTGYHVAGFNTSIFNNTNSNANIEFLMIGNYGSAITPLSGTNSFSLISMRPIYVESGGTNTLRGLYYNPIFSTTLTGTTHIAFENVSGNIKLNSQSGTTTIGTLATGLVSPTTSGLTKMVIVDANGLLSTTIIPSGGTGSDTYLTASTFSNNYLRLTNNTGGTLTTLIDNFSGLTVNGNISGTTYYILDQVSNDYSYLTSAGGTTNFYLANNIRIFGIAPQYIVIGGNGTDEAMIYNTLLTSSRSYNLPDKDGVFALVEDTLNSITGVTFSNNYLTLTNNTGGTLTILIDNFTGLTVNGDAIVERLMFNSAGNYYIDSQNNIEFHNQNDDRFFASDEISVQIGNVSLSGVGNIIVTQLTGSRDFYLPDKSGTFALLSDLSGFTTGGTSTYLTASTFSNNYLRLTNNTGGTLSTLIDNFSGLTVNGNISGTTYYLYDGPNDGYGNIKITDNGFEVNTYDNNLLFRLGQGILAVNNSEALIYITPLLTAQRSYYFPDKSGVIALTNDIITITGGTYSAGTLTLDTNSATTISISGFNTTNSFTGGTVSGPTIFTGGLSATTISATTYLNLPIDIRVTGGTFNNNTLTFRNNTGGTFTTFVNDFSGLTVNGSLSATTYLGLPTDRYVSGGLFYNDSLRLDYIDSGSILIPNFNLWSTTGNTGLNSSINFIGTLDDTDIVIKRNNLSYGLFASSQLMLGENAGNNFGAFLLGDGIISIGKNSSQNLTGLIGDVIVIGNNAFNNGGGIFDSIFIGNNAGSNSTVYGTIIGSGAASGGTGYGTFIGQSAGMGSTGYGTFIGGSTGSFSSGIGCIFVGDAAGTFSSGSSLTAIGIGAGFNSTGDTVTFIGEYAGSGNTGTNVIAIGDRSGVGNINNNVLLLGDYAESNQDNQLSVSPSISSIRLSGFSTGIGYVLTDVLGNGVLTLQQVSGGTGSDTYLTASTFSNNYLRLTNNTGGTLSTLVDNFSGLTVNGSLSATTYLGLPSDVFVTGGTFNNNTLTFRNNTGGTFTTTIDNFTGLTVNGTLIATTSVTTPTILGGTGTTSSITIQAKSGTGTTGNGIIFKVGSNGATTAASVSNAGAWDFGANAITTSNGINGNNIIGTGIVRAGGAVYFDWLSKSRMWSPVDGQILFTNNAGTSFTRLNFGASTSSAPAIAVSGTGINIRLADDSGFTGLQSLYHRFGSGSPESVVTAPIGCLYSRTDGGAGSSLYVKESGTGNTGWVGK